MDMPIRQRPTQGQLALARIIAEGQGSEGAGITNVPASVYTDPARFAAERARLFERMPQVIAPSALLPEPNMAVALGMMGRYPEALALYQQVLPAGEAHYNLGVLCDARHDTARATQEYRAAQAARAADAAARPAPARTEAAAKTTQPTG